MRDEENVFREYLICNIRNTAKKEENSLYDEISRVYDELDKKVEKVQAGVDEMSRYYRISRLEQENTTLILKITDDLRRRVEKLESESA